MTLSLASLKFIAQDYQRAKSNLESTLRALEAHLKTDYLAVKAKLEAEASHWKSEVDRTEAALGADVAAHMAEGKTAQAAVEAVAAGVPTQAAQTAALAAKA